MKKIFEFFLVVIFLVALIFGFYKLFYETETNEDIKTSNNTKENDLTDYEKEDKTSNVIKYYTYEGNGKFVMSSTSNKFESLTKINNNYYIKERITNKKSDEEIVEVLYNDFQSEPYLYGIYTNEEFNKYFSEQIINGLVCDNKTEISFGEGVNIKCLKHDVGYEYEKIDSELCANINDKEICIKPNDWVNIEQYKKQFENVNWICEYNDYDAGKWSNQKPINGILECSKEKPSNNKNDNHELFCFIGTDGGAICNNNIGWCGINNDLNTYCFGID